MPAKEKVSKLTKKDKAFLDKLIADDKINQTDAYLETHSTTNRNTARANASAVLAKTSSQIYLQKHVDIAKQTIVDIAKNGEKDSDRLKASQDILDRNEGKALQKQISESRNLNINVEANEQLATDFLRFVKATTATKQSKKIII